MRPAPAMRAVSVVQALEAEGRGKKKTLFSAVVWKYLQHPFCRTLLIPNQGSTALQWAGNGAVISLALSDYVVWNFRVPLPWKHYFSPSLQADLSLNRDCQSHLVFLLSQKGQEHIAQTLPLIFTRGMPVAHGWHCNTCFQSAKGCNKSFMSGTLETDLCK